MIVVKLNDFIGALKKCGLKEGEIGKRFGINAQQSFSKFKLNDTNKVMVDGNSATLFRPQYSMKLTPVEVKTMKQLHKGE